MEDEWERELESEEDLDLLFIRFAPGQVTAEELEAAVKSHGFTVDLRDAAK